MQEPEAKETWGWVDEAVAREIKASHFSEWGFGAGEMVRNSTKMLKVSLIYPS